MGGTPSDLPAQRVRQIRSLEGRWLTPALIDCHTHLVFGGDRGAEFEARLGGASYEELATSGGGIMATVRATRAASAEELYRSALGRLEAMAEEGTATVEIKSGYGLDLETEIRMLEVARRLGRASGLTVRTTLLAAHAVPPEFAGRPDDYLAFVGDEVMPRVVKGGIADAMDAFCEGIAFNAAQITGLFERARALGLPVKLHADQLSDGGGAELAARFGALSADHLEYSSAAGIEALSRAGTVAVLLPGACLTLDEDRRPPVSALRRCGVPMAVATDCNPGTSPLGSLPEAMALASRLFGLTPAECLAGVTRHAATMALRHQGFRTTGGRSGEVREAGGHRDLGHRPPARSDLLAWPPATRGPAGGRTGPSRGSRRRSSVGVHVALASGQNPRLD